MWGFLLPRRQEGNGASPGPCTGQPDQAPARVPCRPQQHKEGGRRVQAEEGRLCCKQEERGRRAGEAAQGEGDTPAGPAAVQEAWAHPEAAERRTDSRRQRHAALCTDGGNSSSYLARCH